MSNFKKPPNPAITHLDGLLSFFDQEIEILRKDKLEGDELLRKKGDKNP